MPPQRQPILWAFIPIRRFRTPPPCPADVSFQAYSLLHAYLQRFPYVRLGAHPAGSPWAGRPFLVVDERAAWEPLAAAA